MLKHGEVKLTDAAIVEGSADWSTLAATLGIELPPPPPPPIEQEVPPRPIPQSETGPQSHLPAEPRPAAPNQSQNVPHSTVTVAGPVQTNVKQGALVGGWVCLGVGIFFLISSGWTFMFYLPLFLAAFVLSIVAMAQRRVAGGIGLLLATLMLPPIAAVSFASMKAGYAKAQELQGRQDGTLDAAGSNGSASTSTNNPFAAVVAAADATASPKLLLISWKWYQRRDFAIAEGEVQNVSPQNLSAVAATVSFYGDDDKLITSEQSLIEYNPISPGQTAPFKVMAEYDPAMKTATVDFKEFFGGTIPWKKKE